MSRRDGINRAAETSSVTVTTALPRRSNLHVVPSPPAPSPLIERAVELDVLRSSVDRLASGGSGVVVLEAPAGLGKTALLEYGASLATQAGYSRPARRPRAAGAPLLVRRRPRAAREARCARRPARSASTCSTAPPRRPASCCWRATRPAGDSAMLIAHSILWLCSAIAERRPLALVVDDAQWADRSSLEVLSYLARRVEDLPLLILVGARADDPDAASDLLTMLGSVRSATVLHPQPLTPRGAMQLIRRLAPETPAARLPRLSSRGRRQPVAARRARPPDRRARSRGARGLRAGRAPGHRDRPHRRAPAPGRAERRATAASSSALAVIGDGAPPHVLAAVAGVPVGELGPGARRAAGRRAARPGRRPLRPRADRGRDRRGPGAHRARAAAPRGGAGADGLRRRAGDRRQPPARVRAAGRPRGQRPAAARGGGRGARRRAARGGRLPGARAAGARAGRRPRARCWPGSARSPSTPACRTRGAGCARRCARSTTANAGSTC